MKLRLSLPLLAIAFSQATVHATVLSVGETWSALEEFAFETEGGGKGLTQMDNTGSNNSSWNLNSQGGKLVTDGTGQAVTSGDAGTWSRSLPASGYSPAYTSGKYRLEWVVADYDMTGQAVTGTGNETLELVMTSATVDVAGLMFRFNDRVGSDGIADAVQTRHFGVNGNKFSGHVANMVYDGTAANSFLSIAIELDFDNDQIFYERNGNIIAGTGVSGNDLGVFTATGFDQIRLEASGDWVTAGTTFGTDSIALLTVVPEPSTALLGGLGMLALFRRRR